MHDRNDLPNALGVVFTPEGGNMKSLGVHRGPVRGGEDHDDNWRKSLGKISGKNGRAKVKAKGNGGHVKKHAVLSQKRKETVLIVEQR